MKTFKEFRQEQLEESIVADLVLVTKDVSKIAYNVGVIGAKALGRGSVRAVKALAQRYNKQAIADRKAAKELKKLDKAEALRKAKGKKYAHIFDFVVRPPDLSLYSPDEHSYKKVERNLFKRELERIKEFCNDAENGPVAMGKLREIRDRYNLLGYE